jgi:hypothetical protein
LNQGCEDVVEFAFGAGIQDLELEPERAGCRLQVSRQNFDIAAGRIDKRANGCRRGHRLMQQFESLRLQFGA